MVSGADKIAAADIREAVLSDMEAVRAIYNHYVATSTATFDTSAQAAPQRLDWFGEHQAEGLPVLVAVQREKVVGWGSLSFYHTRCAYRSTLEPSIYVHPEHVGKGIGRALMARLLELAGESGCHCLVGLICSENGESLKLCRSFGFETVGMLKEVGRKFDRWLNVTIVQKMLKAQ